MKAGFLLVKKTFQLKVEGIDVNFENLKVMVIDDSKTIRRTAETLLQKEGCSVVTAIDGFDALAKIADSEPDIIFVDIMMQIGRAHV